MTDRLAEALDGVSAAGTLTLRGRPLRMWGLVVLALGFTLAAAAMAVGPFTGMPFGSSRWDSPFTSIVGVAGVLLFGVLGLPLLVVRAWGQTRALVIGPEGVRIEGGPLVAWAWIRSVVPGDGKTSSANLVLHPEGMRLWSQERVPLLRWTHRWSAGVVQVPVLRALDPGQTTLLLRELSRDG